MSKKAGRPSSFTDEVAQSICDRIAAGESLRTICLDADMPDKTTVLRWLGDDEREGFRTQYARARDLQADFYAESIVEIADEEVTMIRRSKHTHGAQPEDDDESNDVEVVFDPTAVARNRLRVDARKWYASKLAPKKYGDKMALTDGDGKPLQASAPIFNVTVQGK